MKNFIHKHFEYLLALCIIHIGEGERHGGWYFDSDILNVLEESDYIAYYDGYWLTDTALELYEKITGEKE